MKKAIFLLALCTLAAETATAQTENPAPKKWGAELNLLWPVFPGNIYKGQLTYETWRKGEWAGDAYLGFHIRPFEFREAEGDFSNHALTFGYRQFFWKGLHAEIYQAFGPGFNRNNAIDGKDYTSWDYELGQLPGYCCELLNKSNRAAPKFSPYISTQHGFYYLAAQSTLHPIKHYNGEKPIYVGILNLGVKF